MEYKYPLVIGIGFSLVLVFFVLSFFIKPKKKQTYQKGRKIANTKLVTDAQIYKKLIFQYKIWNIVGKIGSLIAMSGMILLLATPYYFHTSTENIYNKDIFFCMDISTSVDDLNVGIIDQIHKNALLLEGEQVGISIFNTTSVLLSPLTTDYEYIDQELELLKDSILMRAGEKNWSGDDYYVYTYASAGTVEGSETRGSSLVGDGLASCVFKFPENEDRERKQIIILTTDNDVQGEELVDITKACEIAKKKGIVVYGIAPFEPVGSYEDFLLPMKTAVESTGGSFYVATQKEAVKTVMQDIQNKEGSKMEKTQRYQVLLPKQGFLLLLIGSCIAAISRKKVLG